MLADFPIDKLEIEEDGKAVVVLTFKSFCILDIKDPVLKYSKRTENTFTYFSKHLQGVLEILVK